MIYHSPDHDLEAFPESRLIRYLVVSPPQESFPMTESTRNQTNSDSASPLQRGPLTPPSYHIYFFVPLFLAFNLLIWPWIALAYVWHHGGVPAPQRIATWATTQPRSVTYVSTLFGIVFSTISAFLFSTAIIRFAQKWLARRKQVDVFHISIFMTLKYKFFPWSLKELSTHRSRWYLIIIVGACILIFGVIPPGISALISPTPFNKMAPLTGSELNFALSDPECYQWLTSHSVVGGNCSVFPQEGYNYTSCLAENQLLDVIESGRNTILSQRSGDIQSQASRAFSQLGGVQFSSPIRGVLPMGPNGVPGFDHLNSLPPSDAQALAKSATYNYTLELQGIQSQIACQYDTESPVSFTRPPAANGTYQISGTCPDDVIALTNATYRTILSGHALGFWACGIGERDMTDDSFQSYNLYFRGQNLYNRTIANITCTLATQAAEYSVAFLKQSAAFVTTSLPGQSPSGFPSHLIKQSVQAIGSVVIESQGFSANAMAESVNTLGSKYFGLPLDRQDDMYPKLFEYMLQGIVEYQATYTRLIETAFSRLSKPPDSCIRNVTGSLTYQVIGWHYNSDTIEALLPPTIINLVSFVLLLVAMFMGAKEVYPHDPTDMNYLLSSLAEGGTGIVDVDLHSPVIYCPPANRASVHVDEKVMPLAV